MTTKVIFLVHEDEDTPDLYAVFPDTEDDEWFGSMDCYSHDGQHGICDVLYIMASRDATPEEYSPLLAELQTIYNDIRIINPSHNG